MIHHPRAMILAAGFGTRLKPFSLHRPKPLFPVLDRPLILRLIDQLKGAGFGPVLVNCHHLKEQVIDLLGRKDSVFLQDESTELGTGGGMRLAMDFFGKEPVLVTNGDIFHTIDLARVYKEHCLSGAAATLVLHDYPRFNKVGLGKNGTITGFEGGEGRSYAFTGIHVLDPALLAAIPPGEFFNIIDCYRYHMDKGMTIRGHVVQDHFWSDMGTPEDYLDLHRVLLTEPSFKGESPFYFGEKLTMSNDCHYKSWVCLGSGVTIGRGCHLERVVVWDGAKISDGSQIKDTIVI